MSANTLWYLSKKWGRGRSKNFGKGGLKPTILKLGGLIPCMIAPNKNVLVFFSCIKIIPKIVNEKGGWGWGQALSGSSPESALVGVGEPPSVVILTDLW